MKQLQVLEHEWLIIGQQLSAVQAAHLEKIAPLLPAKALEWRRSSVKFTQFCGVVQVGDLSIEVLPKIARHERDKQLCQRVLVRLLQLSGVLSPLKIGEAALGQQSHTLLEIFIEQLCTLIEQQLKQGAVRCYVMQQESLSTVRGRIDWAQHAKQGIAAQRIACQFDELEANNHYNQALRYVVEQLMAYTQQGALRQRLNEVLLHLAYADARAFTAEQIERFTFNRLTERWQPIFKRCAAFLRGLHPNVLAGHVSALALLFDMNKLFERYVEWCVKHLFKEYRLHTQGPRRYFAQHSAGKQLFRLHPDMTLMHDEKIIAILDAKWKVLNSEEQRQGISQADIYQLASYAQCYQCDELVLVYPAKAGLDAGLQGKLTLSGSAATIWVYCVDLANVLNQRPLLFEELQASLKKA